MSPQARASAIEALRSAVAWQREYVGTVLGVLVTTPSVQRLPVYPTLLGALQARLEVADELAKRADELEANEKEGMTMTEQTPSVGRIVHYVSHGTPVQSDGSQAYQSVCRAAIIAEVYPERPPALLSGGEMSEGEPQQCALAVLNPTGIFFHDADQDENDKAAGTWHWPERV